MFRGKAGGVLHTFIIIRIPDMHVILWKGRQSMKLRKIKQKTGNRNDSHGHLSIDEYAYRSGLKEWNASYKVLFSMAALLAVIALDSIVLSGMTVLFMGILSCSAGKLKTRAYLKLLLIPAVFIVISGIAVLIQIGSGKGSIFSISVFSMNLYLTNESVKQAAALSLKAFGGVSCLYLLTLSTPMGEIIEVLRKFHVPNMILELMHFIYRYIFILLEINHRQKDAIKSRLGYVSRRNSLRIFGNEMANLFIVSMDKSGDYYDALTSRGYEGFCLFWEEKKAITKTQLVWGALYASAAVICCITGAALSI